MKEYNAIYENKDALNKTLLITTNIIKIQQPHHPCSTHIKIFKTIHSMEEF